MSYSPDGHREAEAAIQRVRDIHQPYEWHPGEQPACMECHDDSDCPTLIRWPCPTVRALDGEAAPRA